MTTANPGPALADLGALDGALLLFGGPYSNLQATQALLAEAEALGIPPSRMICTGDVVAYCADAQATADLVRKTGIATVMGNCEESLGFDMEDCGCGFAEDSACDLLAVQWFRHARNTLDADSKAWMRGLPKQIRFTLNGLRLAVVHGGATDISRFVFASTETAVKRAEQSALEQSGPIDGVIGGHCGLPFSNTRDGLLWHNPGVIGMPANDGTPRVWYSLIEGTAQGVRIIHRSLDYDHAAAARKMNRNGLPEAYAQTLSDGLWPNMDILPEAERTSRGKPLAFEAVTWPHPKRALAG